MLLRSIGDWIAWAEGELAAVCDAARFEAELLMKECTGLGRAHVIAFPEQEMDAEQARRFAEHVSRRARGEPFAYLCGRREFYGLDLTVTPAVLIPRPETELLVELALAQLQPGQTRVLDLGTGSGAIALALKSARPALHVTAVDHSAEALAIASSNAAQLNLAVRFVRSNWYAALNGERFDLIVANPPYIRSDDEHFNSSLAFEPRLALDGGADGLDAYRAILAGASGHLQAHGRVLFEHGYDQRDALIALAAQYGLHPAAVTDDLAGQPRALVFGMPT